MKILGSSLCAWILSKKLFRQCSLSLYSYFYELKKLLKVLNPPILFLHSRLKSSLRLFFSSMLSLYRKHNLCSLSFLNSLLSLFFSSNFIQFFMKLPLFTLLRICKHFFFNTAFILIF